MKTVTFALTVAALLAALASPALAEDARVGYVDFNRVRTASETGKLMAKQAREYAAPKIKEVEAAKADYDKAVAAKAKDADAKLERLRQLNAAAKRDIDEVDEGAAANLRVRIHSVLLKLAPEKKLTTVFEASVIYSRNDLTDDVIKRLDAEAPAPVAELEKAKADNEKLRAENAALKAKVVTAAPTPVKVAGR